MDIFVPLIIGLVVGLIGLMMGNMKAVIAEKIPGFNNINPAAVISDSFYCLNIYEDYDRFITKHTERQMIRQAPDPGAMPPGAPTSSHQGSGPKPPQSSHSGMNAPRPQQGGGLNIVDTPKHGK